MLQARKKHYLLFAAVVLAPVAMYVQSLESWAELKTPQAVGVIASMITAKIIALLMKRPRDVDAA